MFYLYKAQDDNKDQSYFLNQLNQYQLSKTLFPLSDINKTEVRKIAKQNGLVTAEKKIPQVFALLVKEILKTF